MKKSEKKYTLVDIKDFLIIQCAIDWKDFQISDRNKPRSATSKDFTNDEFCAFIFTIINRICDVKRVKVNNTTFYIDNKSYDVEWQKFLAKRYGQTKDKDINKLL